MKITVSQTINRFPSQAWTYWTLPEHIQNWYHASDDWGVGEVTNDVRVSGNFSINMHAKDNSAGFDFTGIYSVVEPNNKLSYNITGGREVEITFQQVGENTLVTEIFDAETENSEELQRSGWQAILDNFKKYCESQK